MTDKQLSPAAQAVLDAAFPAYDDETLYIATGEQHAGKIAAAAIRAAVKQTRKRKVLKTLWVTTAQTPIYCLESDLLAIANELENHQ